MIQAWWIRAKNQLRTSTQEFTPLMYVLLAGLAAFAVVLASGAFRPTLKIVLVIIGTAALAVGLIVFVSSYRDEKKRNPTAVCFEVGSPLAWAADFGLVTVVGMAAVLTSASGLVFGCYGLFVVLRC